MAYSRVLHCCEQLSAVFYRALAALMENIKSIKLKEEGFFSLHCNEAELNTLQNAQLNICLHNFVIGCPVCLSPVTPNLY